MQLSKLTDDRAVSPVIGVILMVAITVILAAVIASFVLGGLGPTDDPAPQVTFETEFTNDTDSNGNGSVEVTVTSGERFDAEAVTFSGDLADSEEPGGGVTEVTGTGDADWTEGPLNDGDSVSAGDTITVGVTGPAFEVNLIWQASDGGESSIIRTIEGPDA